MKTHARFAFTDDADFSLFRDFTGRDVRQFTTMSTGFDVNSPEYEEFFRIFPSFSGKIYFYGESALTRKELEEIEVFRLAEKKTIRLAPGPFLKTQAFIEKHGPDRYGGRSLPFLEWFSKKQDVDGICGLSEFQITLSSPDCYRSIHDLSGGRVVSRQVLDSRTEKKMDSILMLSAELMKEAFIRDCSVRENDRGWCSFMTLSRRAVDEMPDIAKSLDAVDTWGQRVFLAKKPFCQKLMDVQPKEWKNIPVLTEGSEVYRKYIEDWSRIKALASITRYGVQGFQAAA